MKLVAFDTQLLIWGVQGKAGASQSEMVPRTQSLIQELHEIERAHLMIPLPAAVEYVCGFDIPDQARQWAELSQRFRLIPFDLRAAQLAARIERRRSKSPERSDRTGQHGKAVITRQQVKVDVQIIASAIAAGAVAIYTDETKHFAQLAQGESIAVLGVDGRPFQRRLGFSE